MAVNRYVGDAYRRHLLLTVRNVTAGIAVALVVAFHFTSELATLVTALGFAAAGVALALQTIIVALAGYFAIVAPNGIRVGDRVSLQGPFAYVQGEVVDIGFLRIKLREQNAADFVGGRLRAVIDPGPDPEDSLAHGLEGRTTVLGPKRLPREPVRQGRVTGEEPEPHYCSVRCLELEKEWRAIGESKRHR